MNKHRFSILLLFIMVCCILSGCNEKTCSYCGKKKQCKEYNVLGTKRLVCQDCINNPGSMSSNSVIDEYKAEELDPSLFPQESNEPSPDAINTSDSDELNNSLSNNNADMPSDIDNDQTLNDSSNHDLSNAGILSKDDFINTLASLLSAYSIQLSPDANESNLFNIYTSNGNDAAIDLLVQDNAGKTNIKIMAYQGASSSDISIVCINSILSCMGSTDYDGIGNGIYNNTLTYGNYSEYPCSFYYTSYTMDEISQGSPASTLEITFQ